jgi:hypothetical protein
VSELKTIGGKVMKPTIADPKKYYAGWLIVGLAAVVGIYSYFRGHQEGVILSPLVALYGWFFAREAKKKKEPIQLPETTRGK